MTPRTLTRSEARAVYDRIGRGQDTQAFYEDPALDVLIAHGGFDRAQSILEVGCGTGRLAERLLRNQFPPAASYVGVDLSSRMVAIARDRLAPFGNRATVVETDGTLAFDVVDGSQERVVATYLLDLLSEYDIRAVLKEARRLLGDEGRLCLAGLTRGDDFLGKLVSGAWTAVHALRPTWVGGCRPLRMRPFLDAGGWTIMHHDVVRAWASRRRLSLRFPSKSFGSVSFCFVAADVVRFDSMGRVLRRGDRASSPCGVRGGRGTVVRRAPPLCDDHSALRDDFAARGGGARNR